MKKHLLAVCILGGSLLNAQVYSSGNLSTGATTSTAVAAPAGYTWSELQAPNTSYGASGHIALPSDFRLSDDFAVPAGESWAISSIEVFAYQTASVAFPIDKLNLRIWDGSPAAAGTIVFGDTTKNILNLTNSADSKMYRVAASAVGTTRRIWKVSGDIAKSFNPGSYWVDYQVHATNNAAIFFPLVTIPGSTGPANANALQASAGAWNPLSDAGSATVQALPFIINYVATSLGTTETRQYDSRLVIYPNPVLNSFKLNVPAESLNAKTEVSIYDQSGKKVKSFKLADSYDVNDLVKGVYLIKLNDGSNIKVTRLIKK